MARNYERLNPKKDRARERHNIKVITLALLFGSAIVCATPIGDKLAPWAILLIAGVFPCVPLSQCCFVFCKHMWIEKERSKESIRRNGSVVLGAPPRRNAFAEALVEAKKRGKIVLDKYLVGFEIDTGEPIWVSDDEICGHGCVFAKTGVGKTLWLEGLMFQQMARGRASGITFIDAKRDPGTLADIIMMALITGRIDDVIVVDPFDPVCAYNFVFTTQRADVKARKVLRCGLPPTSDQSTTKHYDRLAADAVYRVVRAMESLGLAWSVRDIAVALSAFNVAYPRMRALLHEKGAKQAMVELGHLAGSYRTAKGSLDSARLTDNLRGIASELHSISNSEAGEMFCAPRADLSLTDAIRRGKIIYFMLPRLEEAESAARMVKVFREDLEVSIGEITSSRGYRLEDPHMVIIDEGASTFGPTWANLFELARKGRFSLLFGAQSVGGLMDTTMGLSEQFYERVIANVNLKVIMRVGDNRTAMDMSEWIGKITAHKTSMNTAAAISVNSRELTKNMEINRKSSDSFRDGITIAEDEEDLVSPEELKHEMSAEKGLAWFDKGDGRLRKGRAIWFDASIPSNWEGREFLTRYETVETDEIGLAEWVDEHILSVERAETERFKSGESDAPDAIIGQARSSVGGTSSNATTSSNNDDRTQSNAEPSPGGFRLNMMRKFHGIGRSHVAVMNAEPPAQEKLEPEKSIASQVNPTVKRETPIQQEVSAKQDRPVGQDSQVKQEKVGAPKREETQQSNNKMPINSSKKIANKPRETNTDMSAPVSKQISRDRTVKESGASNVSGSVASQPKSRAQGSGPKPPHAHFGVRGKGAKPR